MKTPLQKVLSAAFLLVCTYASIAQTWTLTGTVSSTDNIQDIAARGNTLFAAAGPAGVYNSTDGGVTWAKLADLPDAGFGDEGANRIIIGANGDIIVSGNMYYSGAQLGGVVFRSNDNGASWTSSVVAGMGGYEAAGTIVELPDGTLSMRGGTSNIYTMFPDSTAWTKMTDPGGAISMLANYADTLFVITNFAGLQYSVDAGTTWNPYGTNGTDLGSASPQICVMLTTNDYKFIGFGGSGPFRSGINDTLWVSKKSGLPSPVYTSALATDGNNIWIAYQESGSGNTCYSGVSSDNGDTWTPYPGNTPTNPTLPTCLRKIVPVGSDIFSFAGKDVYNISNVASNVLLPHENQKIHIFPNPAEDNFTIMISRKSHQHLAIKIVDLLGKPVYEEALGFTDMVSRDINVRNLSSGIYFLKIQSGEENYTGKLVIE